jgi:hypothetical protein
MKMKKQKLKKLNNKIKKTKAIYQEKLVHNRVRAQSHLVLGRVRMREHGLEVLGPDGQDDLESIFMNQFRP